MNYNDFFSLFVKEYFDNITLEDYLLLDTKNTDVLFFKRKIGEKTKLGKL